MNDLIVLWCVATDKINYAEVVIVRIGDGLGYRWLVLVSEFQLAEVPDNGEWVIYLFLWGARQGKRKYKVVNAVKCQSEVDG